MRRSYWKGYAHEQRPIQTEISPMAQTLATRETSILVISEQSFARRLQISRGLARLPRPTEAALSSFSPRNVPALWGYESVDDERKTIDGEISRVGAYLHSRRRLR